MSDATPSVTERNRRRLATAFGWLAGGALGLLVNFGLYTAIGERYPTTLTTFALFLVGAFGGMTLADRLGARAVKPLGIAAGALIAIIVVLVLSTFLRAPE